MAAPLSPGLVFFLLLAAEAPGAEAPAPAVREVRMGPVAETKVGTEVVFAGPAAPCGERLNGRFSAFGSGGILVEGPVTPRPEGGCSIRFDLPFSALGPVVLTNANLSALGWSFVGERSGRGAPRPVNWAGRIPREAVRSTESTKVTLARFVRVREVSLGRVGLGASTVTVDLEVLQPLSFDLRIVGASYELAVAGTAVASGRRENLRLHAGRRNVLPLPVELDHGGLLRALGAAAWGGRVEGVLSGLAKLHVPGGELEFPFEFPVTLSP